MSEEIKCTCEGLQEAIEKGVKSMKEEHAPILVIFDYVYEMTYGGWKECKCEASKNQVKEMEK